MLAFTAPEKTRKDSEDCLSACLASSPHVCSVTESAHCMLAACAKSVLTFTLRSRANWQHSMHSTPHPSTSHSTQTTPASTCAADSNGRSNTSSSSAEGTCQYPSTNPTVDGPTLGAPARGVSHADISVQDIPGAGVTAEDLNLDLDDALHDAQQLIQAAEQIVKESCGEKWLLQPFIPDMERNEYRSAHACIAHAC